ncbi:ABC transporter ATP-binding protein/permease [Mycoplasmatota bacterium zrk1]
MISIREVTKVYKTKSGGEERILDCASFIFSKGSKTSVLGQSGSGKTTLLNIIGGLDTDFDGELLFDNEKIEDFDKYRRENISFVFQDYNLISHLNLVQNITLGLTNDISNKEERALDLLNSVGLLDHAYKFPNQLSGGEKQRVAIARALGRDTEVLLCDEPTGNLDEKFTTEIMELIIKNSTNKTVILITHDEALANNYCDEIVEIKEGKLISKKVKSEGSNIESLRSEIKGKSFNGRFFINLLSRKRSLISFSILIILMSAIFLLGLGIVSGIKDEVDQHILREHKVDKLDFDIYNGFSFYGMSTGGFDLMVDEVKSANGDVMLEYMLKDIVAVSLDTLEDSTLITNVFNSLPPSIKDTVEKDIVYGRYPESKHEVLYSKANALQVIFNYNCGSTTDTEKIKTCLNYLEELSDEEIFDTITSIDIKFTQKYRRYDFSSSWEWIDSENDYQIVGLLDDYRYGKSWGITFEYFTPLNEILINNNIYILEEDFIEYVENTGFSKFMNHKFFRYTVFLKEENLDMRKDIFSSFVDKFVLVAGKDLATHEREELQDYFYGYKVGILCASLLLAGFGGIVIYNGIKSNVIRNKKNIGVYRSLGYSSKNVLSMFLKEGMIISFTITVVSIIVWFILKLIINPVALQIFDPNANLGFSNLSRLNVIGVIGIIIIILYFVLSPIRKILKETDIIKVIR